MDMKWDLTQPDVLLVAISTIALIGGLIGVYFAWRDGHFSD